MKSFQESLEVFVSSGQQADLPDFPTFIEGLEAHFSSWQSGLEQMPEDLRLQLEEIEQIVGQGYVDCLQGAERLSRAPDPKRAEDFLDLHRRHSQNLYLFQEEVWRYQGPTPLAGVNQIFWAYEAWMGGGSQEYYWHCLQTESKRLRYAVDTPGMELELLDCARALLQALEQLTHCSGGTATERTLDEVQRLACRYAELLGPGVGPNWLAHLELLTDSDDRDELHAFLWRKLAELQALDQGLKVLMQQSESALLEEKTDELAGLFEEMTAALQDLLEDPSGPLDDIREIDQDLSIVRQEVLALLDAQGNLACPKCAATVEKAKKFCPGCGFRLPDRFVDREHASLTESPSTAAVNPNLAYLQAVSQDYADGKVNREDMELEVARWRKLLAAVPGDSRLEVHLQSLQHCTERLEAWVDHPAPASLSNIVEEMERALSEIARAEAK